MKKLLLITLCISLLMISSAISYYFLVTLPHIKQEQITINQQALNTRSSQLQQCLSNLATKKQDNLIILFNTVEKECPGIKDSQVKQTAYCTAYFAEASKQIQTQEQEAENLCYERFGS